MTDAAPTLPLDQRMMLLDSAVNRAAMQGGRLITRGQTEAVLEYGRPINHVLHAILTIMTLGLWALIWLLLGMQTHVYRRTVMVDEWGRAWVTTMNGWQPI